MPAFVYTAAQRGPHAAYVAYLRRTLPRAVAHVARPPAEVAVALVGDARMAALHRQFLGIDGPTDVLTFELDHDRHGRCLAGEIVICAAHAKREARRGRRDVRPELLLYALHGVLHLSGYDDRTPAGFNKMHRTEDQILRAIGVGTVFADGIGPARAKRRGHERGPNQNAVVR